jgi:hypothetical protein
LSSIIDVLTRAYQAFQSGRILVAEDMPRNSPTSI